MPEKEWHVATDFKTENHLVCLVIEYDIAESTFYSDFLSETTVFRKSLDIEIRC